MPQILGRVVTVANDTLRGPDVVHRIGVAQDWLLRGETIELALPRNLTCAACEGGGCDRCGRAGAISLRERSQTEERVSVTLPRCTAEELIERRSIVLRVPDCGGVSPEDPLLPRGLLLLRIAVQPGNSPGVVLASATASLESPGASASSAPASQARRRKQPLVWVLIFVLLLCALWLFWLSANRL